jgi:acetyltransferase-like isoleucine patch superfamily enzyme
MNSIVARAIFRLRSNGRLYLAGALRTACWRALGMHIGRGTTLPRVHVTWPHQVSVGRNCVLEHDVYFKFDGIYRPGPSLKFGDTVFIGAGCEFNIRVGISVGANTLIASGCRFVDHDHGFASRAVPMGQQADGAEAPIVIEDDVWIGANTVVLKGVTIRHGAVVAAGSVLTRSVGAYEIWGGVPARKLKDRPGAFMANQAPVPGAPLATEATPAGAR